MGGYELYLSFSEARSEQAGGRFLPLTMVRVVTSQVLQPTLFLNRGSQSFYVSENLLQTGNPPAPDTSSSLTRWLAIAFYLIQHYLKCVWGYP